MDKDQDGEVEESQPEVDQLELFKSYALFGLVALKRRRRLASLVFVGMCAIWLVGLLLWPKQYYSESTIVFRKNAVLDAGESYPFSGANDVILRHENLLEIARKAGLPARYAADRTGLFKLKDRIVGLFRSTTIQSEHVEAIVVSQLETSLELNSSDTSLTIGVHWSNPELAVKLVEITQQGFLESRHAAEITTIQEKMSILDEHSARMRKEIDAIAGQLQTLREERVAEIGRSSALARSAVSVAAPAPAAALPRPRLASPAAVASAPAMSKEALDELREKLETKKRELSDLKSEKNRRLLAAKSELAVLLERYTRAHPEVQRVERTVEALSTTDTEQMTALNGEIAAISQQLKDGTPAAKADIRSSGVGGLAAIGRSPQPADSAEMLPTEVLKLLQAGTDVDPAVTVQLQGAVAKYASLRDAIRTARVDLDTAQVAFNHRYKVLAPPELPNKPSKPKAIKVVLIGTFASLLLALLLPILAELRRGVIVARWQVHTLDVPILGELRLPPGQRN